MLIDGEGVVKGGMTRILLQIFSKTAIGPIFFEFIQGKGDDEFGEGTSKPHRLRVRAPRSELNALQQIRATP